MKYFSLLLVLSILVLGCHQNKSKDITKFSQNDQKNGILVDVRTQEEFESGHLKGALHVDWFDPEFASRWDTVPRNRTIYLYCRKGKRSHKAQKLLGSLGFAHVVNLRGGYEKWSKHQK